jgi:DNA-binding NarL/FixJ family response regulator
MTARRKAEALGSILILDDHPLVREGLRAIMESAFQGAAIAEAGTLDAAIAALDGGDEFDFALLDYFVPDATGFSHLTALRARYPALPIIMVSGHAEAAIVEEAIRLGAAGFIPKSLGRALILDAIDQVLAGDVYVPPAELLQAVEPAPAVDREALARLDLLTPQQRRVLELLSEGQLNKQIAHALDITDSTVKAHVSAILEKLGLATRTQAALFFRQIKQG